MTVKGPIVLVTELKASAVSDGIKRKLETARRDKRKRGVAGWWPRGTGVGWGGFGKDGARGQDGVVTISGSINSGGPPPYNRAIHNLRSSNE
jgi:hypothetical protein